MAIVSDKAIGLTPIPRTKFVERMLEHIQPVSGIEWVPLEECGGRVLAQDMASRYMLPSGRSATGDSVAMRYSAFADGIPSDEETATWRQGVDWVRADMGDDFPDEFDCTTHVEGVEFLDGGGIRLVDEQPHITGPEGIKQPGSTMQVGDPLLAAGTVLTPTTMALLAQGGLTVIPVRRRVRVAFIPTGSELVSAGEVLQRGKTPDSNSFMVRQLILDAGCEPIMFPIVSDTKQPLADALERARQMADLVLINGGSSKGSEDYNATLLSQGATFYQHGVRLRPARVAAGSVIDGIPHVNLPGPTMAAHVVWQWLVRYVIARLQGVPAPERVRVQAVLAADPAPKGHDHKPGGKPDGKKPDRDKMPNDEFMRFLNVTWEDGHYVAHAANREAGPAAMLAVNGFTIMERMGPMEPGAEITVELL